MAGDGGRLAEVAAALPFAILAIKAAMGLIQAVAGGQWRDDVTVPTLKTVRRRLRALAKLIPKGHQ